VQSSVFIFVLFCLPHSSSTVAGVCSTSAYTSAGRECRRLMQGFLGTSRYFTVNTIGVLCVMAVIPSLDCPVTVTVYVPEGVGRFVVGPWWK